MREELVPPLFIGEFSFLQPVHFCICWRDSPVLSGYLFRQWLACVCVPNWKNVLRTMNYIVPPSYFYTYTVADILPIGSGEYEEVELCRQTPTPILYSHSYNRSIFVFAGATVPY